MRIDLFEVMSEMLESGGHLYGDPPEPPEWGRIWEIVAAESHGQARYIAWKRDQRGSAWAHPIEEMPRMFARRLARDVGGEPGIRTADEEVWRPLLEVAPRWKVPA